MLEVEVKFAVDDPDALKTALGGWRAQGMRTDEDHYFRAPDRDFAVTDEALRVRSIGSKNWVTYKGPRRDEATKTRLELELPLADGIEAAGQFRRLLEHLGYQPVGMVRKTRQVFASARDGFALQATLDNVEQVGTYAEVEIVAKESDYDRARALVLQVAGELGMKQAERRSYLQMTLAKQRPAAALRSVATIAELRTAIAGARSKKLTIGLVPTMGALHEGHAALIDRARSECGFVVVTIFVNPTQFGPNEDLSRYPRTWDGDLDLCQKHGVDLVFAPQPNEVYPEGFSTFVQVEGVSETFEGASRPGHFRGVATVVLKLFNMAQADVAYFGQKDAQQARIITQMVRDLDVPVRLVIVPTVREPDGVALSSRNRYLDSALRPQAVVLWNALNAARAAVGTGERETATVVKAMADVVASQSGAVLDYAAIVDPATFAAIDRIATRGLAIIAVRIGGTRLIDNLLLEG